MRSVRRRRSWASTTCRMCSGRLFSPPRRSPVCGSMSKPNLVHTTTRSRMPCRASPRMFLGHERAVGLGGVEQRDAKIHSALDKCNGGAPVGAAVVQIVHHLRTAARMPLNTQTDGKDLERAKAPPSRRPWPGRRTRASGAGRIGRPGAGRQQPRRHRQGRRQQSAVAAMDVGNVMGLHVTLLEWSAVGGMDLFADKESCRFQPQRRVICRRQASAGPRECPHDARCSGLPVVEGRTWREKQGVPEEG